MSTAAADCRPGLIQLYLSSIMEAVRKWGIFAAMTVAFNVFVGWAMVQMYHHQMDQQRFIQQELMEMVKENTRASERVAQVMQRILDKEK